MIGMVGAVAVLVWFYYAAEKLGRNPALWAIIGALVYAASRWGFWLGVIRPIMGRAFYSHSATAGFWMETSAIAVAIIVAVLVKVVFLRKAD
ncbi:MAG: hypothetical protein L0Y38_05295 [Methylococcaceae bacterium]|nr:hypothetical protein [Methylococcaceae bacterium]MCI0733221.1 hypothetical protein [Methylococcaceae bacterium]